MNKNVYSVILSNHVVEQLDKLAYQQGRSRSAMIEAIIAQHLSISTPEARIVATLTALSDLFAPGYKVSYRPPAASLVMKNRLRFKYNPTIQYTVSLRSADTDAQGCVSIQVRTQSEELIACLGHVYDIVNDIHHAGQVTHAPGEARMMLAMPVDISSAKGAAGALYTQVIGIDRAMTAYFGRYPDLTEAKQAAATAYKAAIDSYLLKEESA